MFVSDNHYFASSPEGPLVTREITVNLNGNKTQVLTAGGIFSPEHIDQGTQVLLTHLEAANPTGTFLDIGCGWGPIALALALQSPKAKIYAIDVNERSLQLTKMNAEKLGISNIIVCKPDQKIGSRRNSTFGRSKESRIRQLAQMADGRIQS